MFSSVNSNVFDKFGSKLGHSIELYVHDVKREKNMEIGAKQLFSLALANLQQKTM